MFPSEKLSLQALIYDRAQYDTIYYERFLLKWNMISSKYFFKNISLLNIILTIFILIMINYMLLPLLHINLAFTLPSQKTTTESKEIMPAIANPSSPSDYIVIADENLFHPERKIPPEKKEEVPLPKPEIILYGTLITPDVSLAYLEDLKTPRNTPGRGKRQIPLKQGDVMSGFVLKEIQPDKIVMVRGEEKMVVRVYNPNRSKVTEASAPGQPPKTASSSPSSKQQPDIRKLIKEEPPPKTRAPMTQADEKVTDFFKRQRR